MMLNDVGSRHMGSDRIHMSSVPSDVHIREVVVSRSLAHSAAPSPVPSMFEPVQRQQAVMNYNFGESFIVPFGESFIVPFGSHLCLYI